MLAACSSVLLRLWRKILRVASGMMLSSMTVRHQGQKQIEQQFMMAEAGPETFLQETMRYPGKTAVDLTDSVADEWIFFDHNGLPVENMVIRRYRTSASISSAGKLVYKNTFCTSKMTARYTERQILRGGYHTRSEV